MAIPTCRYVPSHLGQLSLLFLRGRLIEYQHVWLGLMRGVFTCVGWQVALCDPVMASDMMIWHVQESYIM